MQRLLGSSGEGRSWFAWHKGFAVISVPFLPLKMLLCGLRSYHPVLKLSFLPFCLFKLYLGQEMSFIITFRFCLS